MRYHIADGASWIMLLVSLWRLHRRRKLQPHTKSLELLFKVGDTAMTTATLGQTVTLTLTPVDTNGKPVVGVKFANITIDTQDHTIATIGTQGADGLFPITLLKVGTVTVTATASVTDPDGVVSTVSGSGSFEVAAGAADARTVALSLTFTVA